MRKQIIICCILVVFAACKEVEKKTDVLNEELSEYAGEWDNFLQVWQENTADDIHRTEVDQKHKHYHLSISENENDSLYISISKGRNGKNFVEKISVAKVSLRIDVDTLFVSGLNHFENKNSYKFIRARTFSGWLEYPMKQYKDSVYRQGNLEIHDQGGMAEIDIEGVRYTAELTQLVYGKRLAIMKLAIYDMPMDSVGINSRSICYTWVNPKAKRIGINLRKMITGWTLIEPGFQNQNTWRKEKQ